MRKIVNILLSVVILLSMTAGLSINAYAEPFVTGKCGDSCSYKLDVATGEMVISGTGDMQDYTNEASLTKNTDDVKSLVVEEGITGIGDFSFYYFKNLKTVSLPDGLKTIGVYAFSCSAITAVALPDSVTELGTEVFSGCEDLQLAALSSNMKTIPRDTFSDCEKLKSVSIPEGISVIGECAFDSCNSLTSVTLPSTLTTIEEYAFFGCGRLAKASLPASLKTIGDSAFTYTALTAVTIPKNVKSIGHRAFSCNEKLDSIKVNKNNKYFDSRNDCSAIIRTKDGALIAGCNKTVLPDGIRSIEPYAFYSLSCPESVTIPNGVKTIGKYAFYNCKNLKSLSVPASVTLIDSYAFCDCYALETLHLGAGVKDIKYYAFSNIIKGKPSRKPIRKVYFHGTKKQFNAINIVTDVNDPDFFDDDDYDDDYDDDDDDGEVETPSNIILTSADIIYDYHKKFTKTTKATLKKNGKIVTSCKLCGKVLSKKTIYRPKTFKLAKNTYVYTGKAIQPAVTVKDVKGKKIAKKYYTVTYKNNQKVGTATAIVKFKGRYSGTKKLTFKIVKKG